jgi:DNA primase
MAAPNRADRNLRLTRTPLRKAIALLLYRPELAQKVAADDPALRANNDPGIKLLTELIEMLRNHPHLSVATLLERYRDTQEGAILERLAAWEPGSAGGNLSVCSGIHRYSGLFAAAQ